MTAHELTAEGSNHPGLTAPQPFEVPSTSTTPTLMTISRVPRV